jgi:hypothetical protein
VAVVHEESVRISRSNLFCQSFSNGKSRVQKGSVSVRYYISNGVSLDSSLAASLAQLLDSVKRVTIAHERVWISVKSQIQ